MRTEYYTAYSEEADMTFVLQDVYNDSGDPVSTTVTGFYFGRPDEESTEKFKHGLQAKFEL